jgi:membrane-bound lytic murein transglycosylase D
MVAAAFCATLLAGCSTGSITRDEPVAARVPAPITEPVAEPEASAPPAPRAAAVAAVDPQPPEDLWPRIQSRMSFPAVDNAEVRREIQWYREHPRYLRGVIERGRPFLHFIAEELDDRDLPGELALLPILESGFRPDAASPYGAAGLWQFMGGTGSKFGLEVNRWYDGRMDVTRSTGAALSYLEALHDRFNDDWLVAIAAYNAGWGNIERVLGRQRRLGRPTDFWSLPLSKESRSLVARMVALSLVFRSPARYGIELEPLPDTPWFAAVELEKPTDLRRFREALGVPPEEFAALNAAYRRHHTGPDGARVLVPVQYLDRARQLAESGVGSAAPPTLVASATARQPASTGSRGQATHRVQQGESLWTIARRHGVTTARLAAANGLSSRSTLRVGQQLRVPGPQSAAAKTNTAVAAKPVRYRVRQGDSLWTISRQFKVSVQQLLAWNGLSRKHALQPGQELVVSRPG